MAEVAVSVGSLDDERYALSQLTLLVPHQTEFSERLDEINKTHGFVDNPFDNKIIEEQFGGVDSQQLFDADVVAADGPTGTTGFEFERNGHSNGQAVLDKDAMFDAEIESFDIEGDHVIEDEILTPKYESDLDKELESVRFYVENEYFELAARTIVELRQKFGNKAEFDEFDATLKRAVSDQNNGVKPLDIAEIRNEFGIDDVEKVDDSDFDTHYQMGIAYQEMGLTEESIREYQDAIALVRPNDGTRRFFQCANLLGHCFMQNSMANLALTWYMRALETPSLNEDEKQGIWYELAKAYEAEGDMENAGKYFEQVYAENVDYRDVGECLKRLAVQAA